VNGYFFVDGVKIDITVTNGAWDNDFTDIVEDISIGVLDPNDPIGYLHNGWFDGYRVTKGGALWTTDFTPPNAEVGLYGPYGAGDTG
jgi:hypothetical protein